MLVHLQHEGKTSSLVILVVASEYQDRIVVHLSTSSVLVDLIKMIDLMLVQFGVDMLPDILVHIVSLNHLHQGSVWLITSELIDVLVLEGTTGGGIGWLQAISHALHLQGGGVEPFDRGCQFTFHCEPRDYED